ncbi:hypothetical protein VW35_06640 [Devosia soli]|uniref:Uncharacterized protein n=1 Tax=Devosia soli TaxID=361041 RepID=A0A0F5LCL4_9HYPH|nr:hypothetical protein VW35_06640 [Devosia soli]
MAADIAAQPDTQVAVFMVPVTLLILAMMFEVGRSVWRNHIPSSAPARRRVALSTGNTPRAGR